MRHSEIRYFLFFIIGVTFSSCFPSWVRLDKKLIRGTKEIVKENPKAVEQYFINNKKSQSGTEYTNLGFGWRMMSAQIYGGFVSIPGVFYYYHDSLISYSIEPELPEVIFLNFRYKKWYGKRFRDSNNKFSSFHFNENEILQPLEYFKDTSKLASISYKLRQYMSPRSGTEYGYRGGYANSIIKNRKEFIEIKRELSNEKVIMLMYSLNPASRLTAIEYYLNNKTTFNDSTAIDKWIETVFTELPKIRTYNGCINYVEEARVVVMKNLGRKYDE